MNQSVKTSGWTKKKSVYIFYSLEMCINETILFRKFETLSLMPPMTMVAVLYYSMLQWSLLRIGCML